MFTRAHRDCVIRQYGPGRHEDSPLGYVYTTKKHQWPN